MSKLKKIKAAQIAAAVAEGLGNPYETGKFPESNNPERVSRFKALQKGEQDEAATIGPDNMQLSQHPIFFGVDMAKPGGDSSNLSGIGPALFEQLKAAMETDVQRLKTIHKMEEKVELKTELLQSYIGFVNDYIAQGHNYPNSVAVRVMIWLFDVNDIEQAIKVGLYLSRTPEQFLPANFERDLKTFICDVVYDWASVELKAKRSASPYLDQVVAVMVDDKWSLASMVESKMYALMAKHEFAKENYSNALHWCGKATEANPEGAGVKGLTKDAQKQLDKAKTE